MKKIEKIVKKNIRVILASLTTTIFLIMLIIILKDNINQFDTKIYEGISAIITPTMTSIAKVITTLGSEYVIIPTCIIIIIFGISKKNKYWKYIIINVIIAFLSNQLIKAIIERPRPYGINLITENGFSFPSGHTMVSTAFYGFFIYLIYKKIENKKIKWTLITLLSILILLIGTSRIYLGVHFASDVVAGFCFSISYLTLYTKILENKIEEL